MKLYTRDIWEILGTKQKENGGHHVGHGNRLKKVGIKKYTKAH